MAEDLWYLRKLKGLTIEKLSTRTGIPIPVIKEYESGKPVRPNDQVKLAKALYVNADAIKAQSAPPPAETARPAAQPKPSYPSRAPRADPSIAPKPAQSDTQPAPAPAPAPANTTGVQPGQIASIIGLSRVAGISLDQLIADIGKPLEELTRIEAKQWTHKLVERIGQSPLPDGRKKMRRTSVPEAVDLFEMQYLNQAQADGARLTIKLFNGETIAGKLIGYSRFAITVQLDDQRETTVHKLSIMYYTRETGGQS